MTEKEILEKQTQNGNREFYMILVGRFLHAYECGAFALSRVMGYRVIRKHRKTGDVLVTGFPIDQFDLVRGRIREAGGDIQDLCTNTWVFRGLDGTPDDRMVCDPQPKSNVSDAPRTLQPTMVAASAAATWLEETILSFNLSASTPMQAMLFLSDVQLRLRDDNNVKKNNACESPEG